MSSQEIHESLVLLLFETEELQQGPIVAASRGQSASNQLAKIRSRQVAAREQPVHVLPEPVAAGSETVLARSVTEGGRCPLSYRERTRSPFTSIDHRLFDVNGGTVVQPSRAPYRAESVTLALERR